MIRVGRRRTVLLRPDVLRTHRSGGEGAGSRDLPELALATPRRPAYCLVLDRHCRRPAAIFCLSGAKEHERPGSRDQDGDRPSEEAQDRRMQRQSQRGQTMSIRQRRNGSKRAPARFSRRQFMVHTAAGLAGATVSSVGFPWGDLAYGQQLKGKPVEFNVAVRPDWTQGWFGVVNEEKQIWKKYLPEGSKVTFTPPDPGRHRHQRVDRQEDDDRPQRRRSGPDRHVSARSARTSAPSG